MHGPSSLSVHDHEPMVADRRPRRQGAAPPPRGGASPPRVGQVEQHGLDPAVHVGLLGQAELREQRVDVLLDRPLGEDRATRRPRRCCLPWAISASTSRSRGVRWSSGDSGGLARAGHQRLDHLGVDDRAAAGDLADGVRRAARGRTPAPSAGTPGPPSRSRAASRAYAGSTYWRQHDDAEARVVPAERGGGPDALVGAGRRHADVGEHDVGRVGVDRGHQLVVVARRGRRPRRRPGRRGAWPPPPARGSSPRPPPRGSSSVPEASWPGWVAPP